MAPRADVAAIVVGGGGGERLGGVSKPDLTLGGVRVIDRVCGVLLQACGAGCVAVVPPTVRVPEGVVRTLEDPPNGGPLAGIDARVRCAASSTRPRPPSGRSAAWGCVGCCVRSCSSG